MKSLRYVFLLTLIGCANSGGGGNSAAALQGDDYSGTYKFLGVECVSSTLETTATARVINTSATTQIKISGNSYESIVSDSSCTVTQTARIVFESTRERLNITNRKVKTSTGASCTHTITLTHDTGGTITPSTLTSTVGHNDALSDVLASFVRSDRTGDIGLYSPVFNVEGHSSDECYIIYVKL